jgi:26S proteasome non-ATPase regulatory subunit 9
MSHIEKGLHEHHARLVEQAQNNPEGANQAQAALNAAPAAIEAPFAKVNSVVAGSPADSAGLQVGDSITKFGWVDWTNHERLSRVAEAVSQNEGVSLHSCAGWSEGVEGRGRYLISESFTSRILTAHSSR